MQQKGQQPKWKSQRVSPLALTLAEEEHDQERDEMQHLLIAQLKLDCQFQHGKSLVYAGRPANWLMVGFGGNEEPGEVARRDSWPPDDGVATPPGIALRRQKWSCWRNAPNSIG